MKKIFWAFVIFAGYVWVINTGREEALLEKGKVVYERIKEWFEEAHVDFQKKKTPKKRRRSSYRLTSSFALELHRKHRPFNSFSGH